MQHESYQMYAIIKASSSREIERSEELQFEDTHTPLEGTPQKHPFDRTKVILHKNPIEETASYWEIPLSSIGRIEECDSIVTEDGQTALIVKLWVRKGTKALLCTHCVIR